MIDEFDEPSTSYPRFSFSDVSDTTVNSSFVNRLIVENSIRNGNIFSNEDYIRELDDRAVQNNFKFNGSKEIQVGNKVYNIFYSKPATDNTNSEQTSSKNNDTEQIIKEPPRNPRKFKIPKPRKIQVIIILGVLLLIALTGVLIYFLLPSNDNNEDPFDSTTPETTIPTTPEITIPTTTSTDVSTTQNEIEEEAFVLRSEWTSEPLNENIKSLSNFPVRRIIVGQTDDNQSCFTKDDCITKIQEIRMRSSQLLDIPWNFLIGGDGRVYEGRGYLHEGEHTMNVNASNYNDIGIGIGLIGNFTTEQPSSEMIDGLIRFIEKSIDNENITKNYKIFNQDQLIYKINKSVGIRNALNEKLGENFFEIQEIITREDWEAKNSCGEMFTMGGPLNPVILHHTETRGCSEREGCKDLMRVLQKNAMDNGCSLSETRYNFLIGGINDYAIVMEGRGFSRVGAHTKNYNTGSLGIGLIGSFNDNFPGEAMMKALQNFISDSVLLGKLVENYALHIKEDYDGTKSPGTNVANIVKNWPNYSKP